MPANTTVVLSIVDAILRLGTPGTAVLNGSSTGSLCKDVGDVSLKVTPSEAKANSRNSRHEMQIPAMFVDAIDVSFAVDSASVGLASLVTAFTQALPIPVYCSDKSGLTGLAMVAGVFDWDDSQILNEVAMHKFTLKPYAVGAGGPFPQFV